MRRCYSTKPIEEIEAELEQKGSEYWKYLLGKAMQDKSLDVLEHFTMTLLVEETKEGEAGDLARRFPYLRVSHVEGAAWLLSMNARTLVELWRDPTARTFAGQIANEFDRLGVCPIFNQVAFGEKVHAS